MTQGWLLSDPSGGEKKEQKHQAWHVKTISPQPPWERVNPNQLQLQDWDPKR
jgi:hypothetical protein